MPVVTISVQELNNLLKEEHPMDVLIHSLEQLGCDVEDTVDIVSYRCPVCEALNDKLVHEEAPRRCTFCGLEQDSDFEKFSADSAIRIDLLADRPDLFNTAGLARAIKGYLGIETGMPKFPCKPGEIEVTVDPSIIPIRPYIVCAEITVPALDHASLRELMKLQENLHWGIGRDRKLASIGIYSLDALTLPITYTSVDPKNFTFHPLAVADKDMTPEQILKEHPKGMAYAHLLEPFDRYPLLIDGKGLVLSMPPIINSEETKCRIGNTRLFADVTGTTGQAINDALNILVCAVIELGGEIKTVKITYPDRAQDTPGLTSGGIDVSYEGARRWLGLDFSREEFVQCIEKMRLDVTPMDKDKHAKETGDAYRVDYPVYRSDIRHEVDIFEDILIGYGIERVPMKLVPTLTVGKERPEEYIANMVRGVLTGLGFTEIMSLNLTSEENHFTRLNLEPDETYVRVDNPKTLNQRVLRSHVMTGVMETLEKNRRKPVPQKVFEIGPVTQLAPETETGVHEYRHLGFGLVGPEAGYAEARAVLDSVMRELGFKGTYKAVDHPTFLEGRCAEVSGENGLWARVGEIHPQVLNNFFLGHPAVYCELRLARVF